ncbi:beta-ketoacyl-ACP synthase III [Roseiconus lacunae]|uniref:Beta-ketoacyl-[acyl-carrier-protein] synthase III n=2 Tax=Roseiconus lacunae TaxID=2605694 RepID=A0ABT7PMI7_9BACT|nr:beta-ketoacyl-ACP synthase III [Roseiconus lacunae]MDM4017728.1 beta-ketoacyl-ACP synthase III [Roseiconus lacunae]
MNETDASEENRPTPEEKSTRGRMGMVPGVRILGSGSFVPDNVVTNDDLAELGCDSEWIVRRTGILERRHATEDQATSDLCYEAATRCLENASVAIEDIDLILVATITPDHFTPSTACHLQRRLGAFAPAMDVGAACAGFMYALTTAAQFVANGNAKRVLVVGADLMSRLIDPNDKKTFPLFGDGAGAVIVGPDDHGDSVSEGSGPAGILSYQLGSEGCGGEMLCIPAGGTRMALTDRAKEEGLQYLQMDGRNVFKWAVRVFAESAKDVLHAAGVDASELGLVVLHQANQRIIDSAVSDLGVTADKVLVNLDRYGNTSGASIPLALDEAFEDGRINRGDYVLLCGFGSGLAWGTALIRY